MKKKRIISFFSAVFLLIVMLLANMPKQWLHYWLAKHTDMPAGVAAPKNGPIIHAAGYNCDVNNIVVVLPYIGEQIHIPIIPPAHFADTHFDLTEFIFSTNHHTIATRGPPKACTRFFEL
ncbi:hypothetical protein [Hydrotalea sp.]|uniref:hypothetical protein n=1 Tax=Hydrotalea sp. TaxID=2881279 RepID=UPI002637A397|nr:hypothetical protein [Hydrotalea sp.]